MKKRILWLMVCGLACAGCCRMPALGGKTLRTANNYASTLTFLSDSTVHYTRSYGWGVPHQEAYATWSRIDPKHLRIATEFTHETIPIDVQEARAASEEIRFVLTNEWVADLFLALEAGGRRFPFKSQTLTLSRTELPRLDTFRIVASADPEVFAPPLNQSRIGTESYAVADDASNVFVISLPPAVAGSWLDAFSFQELDHLVRIEKCGKRLIWEDCDWLEAPRSGGRKTRLPRPPVHLPNREIGGVAP